MPMLSTQVAEPAAVGACYNPAADATQRLTPLLAAAANGEARACAALLDAGADADRVVLVDAATPRTPLVVAAARFRSVPS